MTRDNTHAAERSEAWQRCRSADLPAAFYAYDETQGRSERVVTYRFDREQMKDLADQASGQEDFQFIVHLGLREFDPTAAISDEPAFTMFLQVHDPKEDNELKGCQEPTWLRDSKFSPLNADVTASGMNAIPAAGAYLFVYSWLETQQVKLGQPFAASTRYMGERVRSYSFSTAESKSILLDLRASLDGENGHLDVHLGNGVAVWAHPFSFRPVLEVSGAIANDANRCHDRSAALTDDGGASYYDYSLPDPPGPGTHD